LTWLRFSLFFFFQAEDGIRDFHVTGVQTCALPIWHRQATASARYLGPAVLPPRCNRALPRPPAHAEALGYCDDLRPVRRFVASRSEERRVGKECRARRWQAA